MSHSHGDQGENASLLAGVAYNVSIMERSLLFWVCACVARVARKAGILNMVRGWLLLRVRCIFLMLKGLRETLECSENARSFSNPTAQNRRYPRCLNRLRESNPVRIPLNSGHLWVETGRGRPSRATRRSSPPASTTCSGASRRSRTRWTPAAASFGTSTMPAGRRRSSGTRPTAR